MPKRETEDKGLCRQEQYNKVAVIDRNFLLFSELDKLDENVEKAQEELNIFMHNVNNLVKTRATEVPITQIVHPSFYIHLLHYS